MACSWSPVAPGMPPAVWARYGLAGARYETRDDIGAKRIVGLWFAAVEFVPSGFGDQQCIQRRLCHAVDLSAIPHDAAPDAEAPAAQHAVRDL